MTVGTFWPEQLTDAERAALDPGIPERLDLRPDVLVVGGGIIGAATAAACVRAGLGTVVLIERDHLAAGATGGAGGLLIAESLHGAHPSHYVELGRNSLALWRLLEGTWPGGVGLIDLDWLRLEPLAPELAANLPASAERLDAEAVGALVPGLEQPVGGVRIRDQARVNPLRAVTHLAAVVPCISTGVAALGVTVQGDRVTAVSTSAGEISLGVVVFATGTPPSLPGLDLEIPFGQLKGHIVTTEPAPTQLPGAVAPIATQLDDGRLLAGDTVDTGDDSPDIRPEIIAAIQSDLAAAMPALQGLALSHQWTCFRPYHPDSLPVVDRVPGVIDTWVTSGHFRQGILMAPATGRALAEWIASGQQPSAVASLGIGRFAEA